jgi:uncharacterized membrane protein
VGFAYSVMPGLGRSSDRTMIEAMQNINRVIVNGWFLLLFVGPIPLLILAAVLAWRGQGRPALPWILAALAFYLVAFLITGGVNVPLNDQLAEGGNPGHIHDLAAMRSGFESKWVTWNIARGLLHTVAFGCLAWALVSYGTQPALSARAPSARPGRCPVRIYNHRRRTTGLVPPGSVTGIVGPARHL